MYVGFMDLEKPYDNANREALCQVLKMHDVGAWLECEVCVNGYV